jgi:multidrug resistance protein, MATE family
VYVHLLKKNHKVLRESWHWFNKDSFVDLWPYFRRAINCCFLLILEWWCFEIIHLASSWFGVYQNAAGVVLGLFTFICYMLPLGIQIAASCLVGQSIGEGRPALAKKYFKFCFILQFITCLCTATLVYSLRHPLVSIFTTDPELHKVTVATFIIIPTHIILDSA